MHTRMHICIEYVCTPCMYLPFTTPPIPPRGHCTSVTCFDEKLLQSLMQRSGLAPLLRNESLEGIRIHDDRCHLAHQMTSLAPDLTQVTMASFQMSHAGGVAGDEAGEPLLAMHVVAHLLPK